MRPSCRLGDDFEGAALVFPFLLAVGQIDGVEISRLANATYTTPSLTVGAPSMASLVWNFHSSTSLSGSLPGATPVCNGLPRNSGQASCGLTLFGRRTRRGGEQGGGKESKREDETDASHDNVLLSEQIRLAQPDLQSGFIKLEQIRFRHGPRIESRGPLLAGLFGEHAENAAMDAARGQRRRQVRGLHQAVMRCASTSPAAASSPLSRPTSWTRSA